MNFPKIVNQIWFDFKNDIKLDEEHKQLMEINKKIVSENGFEYVLWNISSATEFIEEHYPFYLSFIKKKWKYEIIKCDFFRYLILYHFGGLYMDLDFILMKPLDHLTQKYQKYDVVLFEEWYNSINIQNKTSTEGSLHNGFILSKPKNKFWLTMINHLITKSTSLKFKNEIWQISGTNLLRNMYITTNDIMIIYQPYYMVCPFKCCPNNNDDANAIILCDNKDVVPLSLKESQWRFFGLNDVLNKKENMFSDSYAVCVSIHGGSLWNR